MKHFTMKELCKSLTADRLKIDNTPNLEEQQNLENLVDNCLDPLREIFGKPIIVNSGFRCQALNKRIGGAKASQHMTGQAADIQSVGDMYNRELFDIASKMDFDQLIWEMGDDNKPDWIHISYVSKELNRHKILKAEKSAATGITYYHRMTK